MSDSVWIIIALLLLAGCGKLQSPSAIHAPSTPNVNIMKMQEEQKEDEELNRRLREADALKIKFYSLNHDFKKYFKDCPVQAVSSEPESCHMRFIALLERFNALEKERADVDR